LAVDHQGRSLGYNADYFAADTHTLIASVPMSGVATLYARIGDGFAYLCVASLLGLAGAAGYRRVGGTIRRYFHGGSLAPAASP
jgi:apolipoprotein N-acyltransferase